jgi:hypothetical protein
LAHTAYYNVTREALETRFRRPWADEGDIPDSIRHKVDPLLHPDSLVSSNPHEDSQMPSSSDPDSFSSLLTPERHGVIFQIFQGVLDETDQHMILQMEGC